MGCTENSVKREVVNTAVNMYIKNFSVQQLKYL